MAKTVSNRASFLVAISVDAVAALGIGVSSNVWLLVTAVIVDGVAFGVFMATSQSFIAECISPAKVGRWLGVYSAAGAVGETAGAAAMGAVAWALGGAAVFLVTAVVLAVGVLTSWLAVARSLPAPNAATVRGA